MPDGNFEYFVRPFQTPWPGAKVIPSTPRDTREKATITWGAKANMPAIVGKSVNVKCCTAEEKQDPLPPEPLITTATTGPQAAPDYTDQDYFNIMQSDASAYPGRNVQAWTNLGTSVNAPEPKPNIFITLPHRQTQTLTLNKKHNDTCAGDWAQFSGVGLAIDEALAEFEADIHAGGAGVKVDHCRTSWQLNNYFDPTDPLFYSGKNTIDPAWGTISNNPYPGG